MVTVYDHHGLKMARVEQFVGEYKINSTLSLKYKAIYKMEMARKVDAIYNVLNYSF